MWIFALILMSILLGIMPAATNDKMPSQLRELQSLNPENVSKTKQLNILGYGLIGAVAWSPDGKTVAAASSTGVIIYDAIQFDRNPYYRINLQEPDPVSIVFSPSGRYLGIGSQPRADTWDEINAQPKTVDIWDFKSQSIVAEWKTYIDFPAIKFSPNGDQIVVHNDTTAQIWNIHDITKIHAEGTVIWEDLQQKWYIPSNVQFDKTILKNVIAFAPNGQYIAAVTKDLTTQIWNVTRKTIISTIPYVADNLIFSQDGKTLAFLLAMEGYNELVIWDIEHEKELFHEDEALIGWDFNPIKPQLLFAEAISNISLWDKSSNKVQVVLGYSEQWWRNNVYSTAFSPHGNELAVARMYHIEVWDSLTGLKLRTRDANEDGKYLNRIVYSPDGKLLATAGQDGYIRLWDADTLEALGTIQHSENAYDVVFSPDGKLLATYAHTDESEANIDPSAVYLWRVSDILTKKTLQSKQALARIYEINLNDENYNVRFSPDGQTLAVTGNGIELWDVNTLLESNPQAHKDGSGEGLIKIITNGAGPMAWSPDGSRMVISQWDGADCSLIIVNINDGHTVTCMKGHTGLVTSVAFDPTGELVASASSSTNYPNIEPDSDNTVRLWDTVTGKQLSLLNKHYEDVWTVAFNSNGTLLASGSGGCYHCGTEGNSIDGTVRLWGVPKSEP